MKRNMKVLLELQQAIIYGPVNSRRLGRSLGINILPSKKKACPFNCVYCQYGWTKIHTTQIVRQSGFPSAKAVKEALIETLTEMPVSSAYITFSGNGEPTLHPDFGQIVKEVTAVRNQLAPEAETAILSNSALISDSTVREDIARLDLRIMKLDCGSLEMFKKFNQPCKGIDLEEITEGLAKLSEISDVTIQTLVSSGQAGNLESQNIFEWIERLKRIKPSCVQLYTLDRGHPANDLKPANEDELNQIKAQGEEEGVSIHIF